MEVETEVPAAGSIQVNAEIVTQRSITIQGNELYNYSRAIFLQLDSFTQIFQNR